MSWWYNRSRKKSDGAGQKKLVTTCLCTNVVEVRSAQVTYVCLNGTPPYRAMGQLENHVPVLVTADTLQRYVRCRSSQSDCFVLKIVIALFLRTANQITLGRVGLWYENYFLCVLKAPPVSHVCHCNRKKNRSPPHPRYKHACSL